ncbi:protein FAM200C-like [Watersipora subatra]|uniref:protein FAM200C-like n=1 Tax=Watersipora subatra TaxID=2589382 RepID=UPI00355BE835
MNKSGLTSCRRLGRRDSHPEGIPSGGFLNIQGEQRGVSYKVAYEIANQKNPHTIGEDLIKTSTLMLAELILGKEAGKEMAAVSLSNNTVQRKISNMANDIKDQVVQQIKLSLFGLFAIHELDESTDIASCSQLIVYARYVHNEEIKRNFCFVYSWNPQPKLKTLLVLSPTFVVVSNVFSCFQIGHQLY